jgi:hypothetical protein
MFAGFALLLSVQVGAPGPENWSYLTCMTSSAGAYLATKPSRAEYTAHLDSACSAQREKLRREFIRRQLVQGQSKEKAERSADEFFLAIKTQMLDLQP